MKTALQVVQHLRPGGIETLTLDLCAFAAADEKTVIVSLEGERRSALAAWPRLQAFKERLIFLDKKPGLTPLLTAQLIRIIRKTAAQTVHTHHIGPLLYAGLAARLAGVKQLIHTEHDAWHLHNSKRCQIQRAAIKLLQPLLVADAQHVAENMQTRLHCTEKIRVIRNGIDSQYFVPGNQLIARAHLMLPSSVQIIGCSGRMEAVKGQHLLIEALAELPLTVHLAFAGSGSNERALRKLARQLGLQERIHFLGHIDAMPAFYQALDLFCLPSLNEGFPLSPLEAQACNINTLVTDVGGSKETLCPQSGRYIAANNSALLADTLLKMLCNPGNKPRAYIEAHNDVRIMAQAYADLRRANNKLRSR